MRSPCRGAVFSLAVWKLSLGTLVANSELAFCSRALKADGLALRLALAPWRPPE